jgi:NTE family protein
MLPEARRIHSPALRSGTVPGSVTTHSPLVPRDSRLSVGLVLSAGGGAARAFHAGVLAALEATTGWDPRQADLVVGTSAGSTAAAYLRAGLSAPDDLARFTGDRLSAEGAALMARLRPPSGTSSVPATDTDRSWASMRPLRASLLLRALGSNTALATGLAGLAPAGTWANTDLGDQIRDVAGMAWPSEPTWICATRVRDGRRVVFGRDDVATPDIGAAAQASCAIPRVIRPVRIGRDLFIDGATHSSTNADLVAPLAFDVVVIVSSMTASAPHDAFDPRRPARWWFSRLLAREVAAIRGTGTPVLVVQPEADDLAARTGPGASQAKVARQAQRSAAAHFDRLDVAEDAALERLRAVASASTARR